MVYRGQGCKEYHELHEETHANEHKVSYKDRKAHHLKTVQFPGALSLLSHGY